MTKLPSLKTREVILALQKMGFSKVRQKGSHALFHHPDCRRAPVPVHPTKSISRYLLSDILKQLGIDEDTFISLVKHK